MQIQPKKSSPPAFGHHLDDPDDFCVTPKERSRSICEDDSETWPHTSSMRQNMLLKANFINRLGLGSKAFGSLSADYMKQMTMFHERERQRMEEEDRETADEEYPEMERTYSHVAGDFAINFFEKSVEEVRQGYINKLLNMKILNLKPSKKHQTIIIFDWDDTLLCTSFLLRIGDVDKSSEDLKALKPLDDGVSKLLLKAIGCGEVFIITNSEDGWVEYSAKFFLPKTLDVIIDNKVQIISARSKFQHHYPCDMKRWKQEAFLDMKKRFDTNIVTNLICLGDSSVEIEAGHMLARQFSKAMIKTVKFKENPLPEELVKQVELVLEKLDTIFVKLKNLTVRLEKKPQSSSGKSTMLLLPFSATTSILLTLFALFLVSFIIIPFIKVRSYKGRPGVETFFFPVIGCFLRIVQDFNTKGDAMASPKEASKRIPGCKYLVSNLNTKILYALRDPAYVRECVHKQDLYHKADFLKTLVYIFGNGLVTAEGNVWKRHRKIISSTFNYEFLKANIKTIQDTTKEFLDKISPADYDRYSILDRVQDITGQVVGRIFFGESLANYDYQGTPLTKMLAEVMAELCLVSRSPLIVLFGPKVLNIPFIPSYKSLMDKVRGFRAICTRIIQDRKANPQQSNDLLGLLLETQKSEDPEQRFTDDDIIDEFGTFFFAGMDTTGHLATMALYNLSQHTEWLEELEAERKSTYNKEKVITAETLQSMDVLHSILKETLRFCNPIPGIVPRQAVVDHDLLDLKIKKGDVLTFELFSIFFNEKYFDNPFSFDPTRWKREPKLDPYAFIPFSGGSRNCIGQHLAIMEAKIIISEFLEKFSFKVQEGYKLRMAFRLTYEPADELIFLLTPKNC